MPVGPIIQGDPEITTVRNPGNGVQRYGDDGILYADRPHPGDHTEHVDGPFRGLPVVPISDDGDLIARPTSFESPVKPAPAAAGAPPDVPPTVDVMQADQPGEGGEPLGKPQVISPEQLVQARAKKVKR